MDNGVTHESLFSRQEMIRETLPILDRVLQIKSNKGITNLEIKPETVLNLIRTELICPKSQNQSQNVLIKHPSPGEPKILYFT